MLKTQNHPVLAMRMQLSAVSSDIDKNPPPSCEISMGKSKRKNDTFARDSASVSAPPHLRGFPIVFLSLTPLIRQFADVLCVQLRVSSSKKKKKCQTTKFSVNFLDISGCVNKNSGCFLTIPPSAQFFMTSFSSVGRCFVILLGHLMSRPITLARLANSSGNFTGFTPFLQVFSAFFSMSHFQFFICFWGLSWKSQK